MDFLMNAAKIAQQVQGGGKKPHGGASEAEDGPGMHSAGGSKPRPPRDDEEYDDSGPHASQQSAHGGVPKKKASTSELYGSAQVHPRPNILVIFVFRSLDGGWTIGCLKIICISFIFGVQVPGLCFCQDSV